jgi:hypothetical protein
MKLLNQMINMFLCHGTEAIPAVLSVSCLQKMTNQLRITAGLLFDELYMSIRLFKTKNINNYDNSKIKSKAF